MPIVYVAQANRAQLLHIATVELGLDVKETATASEIREAIRQSGTTSKSFDIDASAVLGGTPPSKKAAAKGDYTHVRLTIQPSDGAGGSEPVWLAVNGKGLWVPRGEPVLLKRIYFEGALEPAIEVVYPETSNPRNPDEPALGNPINRQRFSYTVHAFEANPKDAVTAVKEIDPLEDDESA